MIRRSLTIKVELLALILAALLAFPAAGFAKPIDPIETVRSVLSAPDDKLDFAKAKLALDHAVDPSFNSTAIMAELDRLATEARKLAGPEASDARKFAAIRAVIYKPGPWNGNRPFSYDHQAPRDGSDIETKMLANYLKTRLGNCVSMPALFLILADKIGLKVTLSTAPNHLFVRYIAPDGQVTNLETTSGGNPARDAWLRTVRPMSDRSVYTGAYLSTLTRREAIANLATTVVEDLMRQGRYEEVIQACDIILKNDARNIFCYYDNAVAYSRLQQVFVDKYQTYDAVPDELLPGYEMLVENERTAKEKAVDLGWERYPHPTLGMQ